VQWCNRWKSQFNFQCSNSYLHNEIISHTCTTKLFQTVNHFLLPIKDHPINAENRATSSYVYWTVHHLDSWIKREQLDVTCFIISLFNAQHGSNVSTSILGSLLLICWIISWVVLLWFDVCWCYGVVRLGWCGILMQAEAPPQPNHTITPTHIELEQYNPWNNSRNK